MPSVDNLQQGSNQPHQKYQPPTHVPTLFKWTQEWGNHVSIAGSFDPPIPKWTPIDMPKNKDNVHEVTLDLLPDKKYYYKFVVDDNWVTDGNIISFPDSSGNWNHEIQVKLPPPPPPEEKEEIINEEEEKLQQEIVSEEHKKVIINEKHEHKKEVEEHQEEVVHKEEVHQEEKHEEHQEEIVHKEEVHQEEKYEVHHEKEGLVEEKHDKQHEHHEKEVLVEEKHDKQHEEEKHEEEHQEEVVEKHEGQYQKVVTDEHQVHQEHQEVDKDHKQVHQEHQEVDKDHEMHQENHQVVAEDHHVDENEQQYQEKQVEHQHQHQEDQVENHKDDQKEDLDTEAITDVEPDKTLSTEYISSSSIVKETIIDDVIIEETHDESMTTKTLYTSQNDTENVEEVTAQYNMDAEISEIERLNKEVKVSDDIKEPIIEQSEDTVNESKITEETLSTSGEKETEIPFDYSNPIETHTGEAVPPSVPPSEMSYKEKIYEPEQEEYEENELDYDYDYENEGAREGNENIKTELCLDENLPEEIILCLDENLPEEIIREVLLNDTWAKDDTNEDSVPSSWTEKHESKPLVWPDDSNLEWSDVDNAARNETTTTEVESQENTHESEGFLSRVIHESEGVLSGVIHESEGVLSRVIHSTTEVETSHSEQMLENTHESGEVLSRVIHSTTEVESHSEQMLENSHESEGVLSRVIHESEEVLSHVIHSPTEVESHSEQMIENSHESKEVLSCEISSTVLAEETIIEQTVSIMEEIPAQSIIESHIEQSDYEAGINITSEVKESSPYEKPESSATADEISATPTAAVVEEIITSKAIDKLKSDEEVDISRKIISISPSTSSPGESTRNADIYTHNITVATHASRSPTKETVNIKSKHKKPVEITSRGILQSDSKHVIQNDDCEEEKVDLNDMAYLVTSVATTFTLGIISMLYTSVFGTKNK